MAPRLRPEEVSWITEVTPVTGESARLLNISTTGVLLETTARLEPDRHATVMIVTESDLKHQADGEIVRTELVSIGKNGELVYRTAMAFISELDLRSPATGPAQADAACVQPQLEGPLSGRWQSPRGAKRVQVTHVTAGGCYVLAPGAGAVDEPASVPITFSPGRPLTLHGKVAAVEAERGFLVQFDELLPETRRALRFEICEGIVRGAAARPAAGRGEQARRTSGSRQPHGRMAGTPGDGPRWAVVSVRVKSADAAKAERRTPRPDATEAGPRVSAELETPL
jgi:hypothetical protein